MQKLNNGFKNLIWFQTRTADQAFKKGTKKPKWQTKHFQVKLEV